MTITEFSTVFARCALLLLCLIVVVTADRRLVRALGAFGAILLAASVALIFARGGAVSLPALGW
jgi:hypothetical protein